MFDGRMLLFFILSFNIKLRLGSKNHIKINILLLFRMNYSSSGQLSLSQTPGQLSKISSFLHLLSIPSTFAATFSQVVDFSLPVPPFPDLYLNEPEKSTQENFGNGQVSIQTPGQFSKTSSFLHLFFLAFFFCCSNFLQEMVFTSPVPPLPELYSNEPSTFSQTSAHASSQSVGQLLAITFLLHFAFRSVVVSSAKSLHLASIFSPFSLYSNYWRSLHSLQQRTP